MFPINFDEFIPPLASLGFGVNDGCKQKTTSPNGDQSHGRK